MRLVRIIHTSLQKNSTFLVQELHGSIFLISEPSEYGNQLVIQLTIMITHDIFLQDRLSVYLKRSIYYENNKKADVRKNEILDAVGIARGTLYHHFKSKEHIMDGLIARQAETMISAAQKIAEDKSIPVEERMVRTILSLKVSEEGLFRTPYPLECMELTFVYLKTISDDDVFVSSPEQLVARIKVFLFHLEKLLDVEQGRLDYLMKLFGGDVVTCDSNTPLWNDINS